MPLSDSFQEFLGEEIVDVEGHPVGTFACFWEREQDKPVLLGIHCNGDTKRTHLAPAKGAKLNVTQIYVSVIVPRELIRQAPSLDCGCELDAQFEAKVLEYYGLTPTRQDENGQSPQVALKRVFRVTPGGEYQNSPPGNEDSTANKLGQTK